MDALSKRDKKRRTLTICFWIAQALLLAAALAVRLASPSVILTPMQLLRTGDINPSNVCATVSERLLVLSNVPGTDQPALNARIASLDAYLQGILYRMPSAPNDLFSPDFIKNVKDLKAVCARWDRQTSAALTGTGDTQSEFLTFRSRFRDILRRAPKPAPLWYLHIARSATGLLEGLTAPALIPWRTGACALNGHLSAKNVFHPSDWRRSGPAFAIAVFYGSLLCAYLCAWLALRFARPLLCAPGFAAVAYGAGHFLYAVMLYF